ncbi:MAG: hypothetical protein ACHQPI_05085 [Thermoanaerobaculia bacterium]
MTDEPVPYADEKHTTYENFEARCPHCDFWNVFNRVTDLKTVAPISFRTVECLDPACGLSFNINGDLVNSAYHMFIMECYPLKKEKRYSHCIVSLVQAYELFFSHYLYDRLVVRPLRSDPDFRSPKDYRRLSDRLYARIERLGYRKLRNVFFGLLLDTTDPKSANEAERLVDTIPKLLADPTDDVLAGHPDPMVGQLLLALKRNTVDALRNRVVHQEGYRPSLQEVEAALEETRAIIFPLRVRLGVDM